MIGRVFWDAPVQELLDGLEANLDLLEQRGFVRARTKSSLSGEREYAFKHQFTREVAYSSLPKAERGRLHAAVARRLERGETDARAALLAHHYEQAVREDYAELAWCDNAEEIGRLRQKALQWLQRASERAASRYEMDAAVAMLERALELAEDDPTRYELWRGLASAHALRFDATGFVSASEHAIALAPDDRAVAGLYAELAFRSGTAELMWNPPLARELADGWVERALAGTLAGSRERAKALVARAWHEELAEAPAREALAIAERLNDPELLAWALRASVLASSVAGRYDLAAAESEQLVALIDEIADPGPKEMLLQNTALRVAAVTGRFEEARRFSELIDGLVRELTPHHRLHGVAYALEIEELAAGWNRIRELEARVEQAVEENRDTPCVRNARSLLVCALAESALGDDHRARRFEGLAAALGMAGHERVLNPPRIRSALLRGDAGEVRRLLERYGRPSLRFLFDFAGAAAWLDAGAALDLTSSIEQEAPALAQPGTCIEPFALRALGVVRQDAKLLARADRLFSELGLGWYADQRIGPR